MAGPAGVLQNLEEDATQPAVYSPDPGTLRGRYLDWKRRLYDEHGIALGLRYQSLAQRASDVVDGDKDALGYLLRLQGSWQPGGEDKSGRLEWRVEGRDAMGGRQSPAELSNSVGAAATAIAPPYPSDFDFDLNVLSWTQKFDQGRFALAAGRLAFPAYLDPYFLQSISGGLFNSAFFLNPTLGGTGVGALGIVGKARFGTGTWVRAQIYDANAVNGEFSLDTLEQDEWLRAIEVGWSPSFDRSRSDRLQLTFWTKDELREAEVDRGVGWLFTGSWELIERWVGFLRVGVSNGGGGARAESTSSLGYEFEVKPGQTWSLGAGWARPSSKTFAAELEDEFVVETSYELQISPGLSITPDLQLLIDPALNPGDDVVWIAGLRMSLSL